MALLISLPESLYIQESDQKSPLCGLGVCLAGGYAVVCFQVVREDHTVPTRLPSDLEQSTIEVSNDRENRHGFVWKVDLAAAWVSYHSRESCGGHAHFPLKSKSVS